MNVARMNELILEFGTYQKEALRAEQRGKMTSVLFDLPRRSVLGWWLKYDHQAGFLREVAAVLPPEEVGRRMKVPGSRPYFLQLFLMLQDPLGIRQQRMLELGLREGDPFPEERLDDLAFVLDFWERASRAYRNDGNLVPEQAGRTQPILEEARLDEVRALLRPVSDEYAAARRFAATVDAYCFVAHGEQRDGTFGHGPYEQPDGTVLFFREYNDLRNDFLPWAQTPTRNAFSNVVVAYECRDVRVACNFFAGLVTDPLEVDDRLERFAVLTQEEGVVRALGPDEWAQGQELASAATNEIYFDIVEWSPRYRVEYGAHLFANHIKPFTDMAGIDADDRLRAAAEETIARHAEQLIEGPDVPLVMTTWSGTSEGNLFWPVVPA